MNAKMHFSTLAAALALALPAVVLPEEAMAQTSPYDVSGIYMTTYYSPVESYHPRSCLKTIFGWVNKTPSSGVELSGSRVELGTYPCRFVNRVANEGSGKRTNLSTGPSSASSMTALNYSTEGMPGGGGGYWLDTCPRNSFGGCLQPMRSSAASSALVNGGDMRPYVPGQQLGTEYVLKDCGTDPFNSDQPMNSTTCDWYKDAGSPWLVDDEFSTDLVDPSTKQIDLYYGFEDRDNIQNTDYIMDFKNAVATVTGEKPAPDTPQEPPPPPLDTYITSASTASLTNSTTATFGFSPNDFAATFECKRDGAAFEACASPKEYSGLAEGQHTFEVRAKNAGGVDETPASWTWTVDTTAPPIPVFTSPANGSTVADGNITFFGTAEANSTVDLSEGADSEGTATVDASGGWSKSLTGVTEGSHTYTARAMDAAGNTSDPSAALTVDVKMPPQVVSVSPAGQAQNVASSTNVEATFSKAMESNTLSASTFTLTKQGSTTPVKATVTYDEATKSAKLDPGDDLPWNTTYTATIKGGNGGVQDLSGNALEQDHSWTFTTIPDTNAPKVDATTPTNNATGVGRGTNLTAAFSEAVNPSTVTTSTFTLVKSGSTTRISAGVGLSPDGKTVTLNPYGSSTTNLARCTTYKATVTTGVKDGAGNPLAANKVWSFKTSC
jgi:Bacterial Ig-like domain